MRLLMVNDASLELHTMERDIPWASCGVDRVFTAESAAQAREILEKEPMDLLLCDIEMPGENGISLIRWIRERQLDIDCILLTCHVDFTYAKAAITLGCREYIVIPAPYSEIAETVRRIAEQRASRLESVQMEQYGKAWIHSQKEQLQEQENKLRAKSPKETVRECEDYIMKHLSDPELNVNGVSARFYLNPIYMSRIFKKENGVALNQWIVSQRMELAGRLLQDSDYPAVAVAERCGYTNYPYFSTVFKKYYGCTPSQFLEGKGTGKEEQP